MVTHDRNRFLDHRADYFEATVSGERVLQDMKREGTYGDCGVPPDNLGWREGVVDLSPWRGQYVSVRFHLYSDVEYNTWVYVDGVRVG